MRKYGERFSVIFVAIFNSCNVMSLNESFNSVTGCALFSSLTPSLPLSLSPCLSPSPSLCIHSSVCFLSFLSLHFNLSHFYMKVKDKQQFGHALLNIFKKMYLAAFIAPVISDQTFVKFHSQTSTPLPPSLISKLLCSSCFFSLSTETEGYCLPVFLLLRQVLTQGR